MELKDKFMLVFQIFEIHGYEESSKSSQKTHVMKKMYMNLKKNCTKILTHSFHFPQFKLLL